MKFVRRPAKICLGYIKQELKLIRWGTGREKFVPEERISCLDDTSDVLFPYLDT
jgi:hypothetical protein